MRSINSCRSIRQVTNRDYIGTVCVSIGGTVDGGIGADCVDGKENLAANEALVSIEVSSKLYLISIGGTPDGWVLSGYIV